MNCTKLFWIQNSNRYGISSKMKTYNVSVHSSTVGKIHGVSQNGTISTDVDFDRIEKKICKFFKLQLDVESIKIIIMSIKKTGWIEANDIIGVDLSLYECISFHLFKNSNNFMHKICGFFNEKYQMKCFEFSWILC